MTVARAAPGPQLSTGRLRVDAARAIAKLREYQLVDRSAWILEAIRAAVAGGAVEITLSGDANDVWLAWSGPAWPVDELPKLFDELVSPEPLEERHHFRLLAAAINSALGMAPAYVDIYTVDGGEALRARYTPDVLDEPTGELEDSPLRRIAAVPASIPAGIAPYTGMLVHLRRRAALGMLTYLFWEREPPELATARRACRDIAVPLRVGNATLHRDKHGEDVLRLPLGDDMDGFVAIVDPRVLRTGQREVELVIAERGVVLATYTIEIPPFAGTLHAPVPLRVFVDGKRMPTNVSRSQVRRDLPPITTATSRASALATKLIAIIAESAATDDRCRRAAIAMIASVVGGPQWSNAMAQVELGPLARLPLLADAGGTPRPITHCWTGLVYTGSKPLPDELAVWVPGMLWVRRGDPAAAILAGVEIDAGETKRQLKFAKKMRRSQRRFFRHQPRAAILDPSLRSRARMTLGAPVPGSCVPDDWFADLKGEVALVDRSGGELTVLYQGRPIDTIFVDAPIAFAAVIDSPQLTPADRYKGIARDAYHDRVELAAKGMVIRLVEAVALARWRLSPPPGLTLGDGNLEVDARLVRAALGLAADLRCQIKPPLATTQAWHTADDRWIDYYELGGFGTVGFATGIYPVDIRDRLIVRGGASTARKLLPALRIVDYDHQRTRDDGTTGRAERMARQLAMTHKVALAVEHLDVRGAIAPSTGLSKIRLYHAGTALDTGPCAQSLLPSISLAVDADSIVPDAEWKTAADPGLTLSRNYIDWELALVRAAARAFVGDRPPELIGGSTAGLDSDLGRVLCHGLALHRGELDPAVLAKLRAAPIIHVLGERDLISVDELVKRFPIAIPMVDKLAAPVDGFAPMVGDDLTGKAIAQLASVPVVDGRTALEDHRREAARRRRIEAHRAHQELPLVFPLPGPWVALEPAVLGVEATGVVGLNSHGRLEIAIRVENRPFQLLTHSEGPPLFAVVELDPVHVDALFENLTALTAANLTAGVKKHVRLLLAEVAATTPESLADAGAMRALLAQWLKFGDPNREEILAARAFPTLQGTRMSLLEATAGTTVRTATYDADWLGPGEGEAASALDLGVLRVPLAPSELAYIIRALHKGPVVDVTDQVVRLQSARRIARGLVRAPSLGHVDPEFKRKLSELPDGDKLGPGEIGLVSGVSTAHIHVHGELKDRLVLDVLPAVHVAIEAPDLGSPRSVEVGLELGGTIADQLARLRDTSPATRPGPVPLSAQVQKLVEPLLADVAAKIELPPSIRRSVRRAVLTRRLVTDAPVFELVDGSWVGAPAVRAQISRFGNAWSVPAETSLLPLDPERLVFVLTPLELSDARGNFAFVDATTELDLDAKAARNRARPKARELAIPDPDDLIGTIELDGDGVTKPRGVVAPLRPTAFARRGLYAHRAMHPFDVTRDPCSWPTIAVVDDARLEPDRTWAGAAPTAEWSSLVVNVQFASDRAIYNTIERPAAPAFARTSEGIDVRQDHTFQVRGAAWIVGPPLHPSVPIEIVDARGARTHLPPEPLGIAGQLFVMGSGPIDQVIRGLYKLLVRRLAQQSKNKELVAAHLANALALGVIEHTDIADQMFDCFRPKPLSAAELASMFELRKPVRIYPLAELEADLIDDQRLGVVEDGSALSEIVIWRLGKRADRRLSERRKPGPEPTPPAWWRDSDRPTTPVKPIESPPETRHPIQILADYLQRTLLELGIPDHAVTIADRESPIVDYKKGLQLAGDNARLRAVANAMHARSPWAETAADAVLAHAIAVLDIAATEINAETHRKVLAALLI